jgi:hypothetical protein
MYSPDKDKVAYQKLALILITCCGGLVWFGVCLPIIIPPQLKLFLVVLGYWLGCVKNYICFSFFDSQIYIAMCKTQREV